jgi:taurine dioxygenase
MSLELTVLPITPSIGAEVSGVSLAAVPGDEPVVAAIRAALCTHQVLVFRNQELDRDQHKALGRLFGELHVHPSKRGPGTRGDPEIFTVKSDENTRRNNGGRWHMDVSCDEVPPRASILRLTDGPPGGGGDTLFANMNLAFEMLSKPIQTLLLGLSAYHDGLQDLRWYGYEPEPGQTYPATSHPVVVAHPETGCPILNVNQAFTSHIEGVTQNESDALLAMLFAHIASNPGLQCRVRWEPGTVVIWDNRAVQHYAVWDYAPHLRRGERVTVCGDGPPAPALQGARPAR